MERPSVETVASNDSGGRTVRTGTDWAALLASDRPGHRHPGPPAALTWYCSVVMTFLIFLAGLAVVIGMLVGWVVWRDRRRRGSFVDPTISREALAHAERQAVQGRLAADGVLTKIFSDRRPESHSRNH
jgi:hypothetical protein